MDQAQLVSAVKESARIPTHEQAEQAVHATLQVLGQRLAGGETKDLASQLPGEFANDLPADGPGERFGVDEFYRRVAERESEDCTPEQARQHARAVTVALKNGLTGREIDHVAEQLSPEFKDLLVTGPVQH